MSIYIAQPLLGSGLNLNKVNERAAIIGGGDSGVARECISKILLYRLV